MATKKVVSLDKARKAKALDKKEKGQKEEGQKIR